MSPLDWVHMDYGGDSKDLHFCQLVQQFWIKLHLNRVETGDCKWLWDGDWLPTIAIDEEVLC